MPKLTCQSLSLGLISLWPDFYALERQRDKQLGTQSVRWYETTANKHSIKTGHLKGEYLNKKGKKLHSCNETRENLVCHGLKSEWKILSSFWENEGLDFLLLGFEILIYTTCAFWHKIHYKKCQTLIQSEYTCGTQLS